jgi:hypothetical protein
MDHCGEALIGLVGAQRDAFELLEFAEEVFDQMTPFVHFFVDGERSCAARMLGDDGLHLVSIRYPNKLDDDSLPATLTIDDRRGAGHRRPPGRDARRRIVCWWRPTSAGSLFRALPGIVEVAAGARPVTA